MEKTNEVYSSDYSYTIEDLGDWVVLRLYGVDELKIETHKRAYNAIMKVRGEDGIFKLINIILRAEIEHKLRKKNG